MKSSGSQINKFSEYQEQCLFVQYLDKLIPLKKVKKYTAIPNSTWTPSILQKVKNKRMGLNSGFPDLIILTYVGAVCIEMKVHSNKPTENQNSWIEALSSVGIPTYVAYGYEEAKRYIDNHLGIENAYE